MLVGISLPITSIVFCTLAEMLQFSVIPDLFLIDIHHFERFQTGIKFVTHCLWSGVAAGNMTISLYEGPSVLNSL